MTTLNTIIEEEKEEFNMKFTNCLQGATILKFIGTSEYKVWAGEEIKSFLATAMQRAYEAGRTGSNNN